MGLAIPFFSFFALALAVLHVRVRLSQLFARRPTIGFLHPYCNDGGGGERVLWVAIRELVARGIAHPDKWRMVVYTGDRIPPAELRANARHRFGVELPESLEFVQLSCRGWIEPSRYPVATLLGQALGSVLLAAEALLRAPPDVLVDTTGLAYCFPLVRAAGVRHLACYVHYPIVQSDMLGAVAARQAAHNNAAFFARSAVLSALKLAYYRLLLGCYAGAGGPPPHTMDSSPPHPTPYSRTPSPPAVPELGCCASPWCRHLATPGLLRLTLQAPGCATRTELRELLSHTEARLLTEAAVRP